MYNISTSGDTFTLRVEGRMDHDGAGEIKDALPDIISGAAGKHLIVDLEGLTYISSEGLRTMLMLRKQHADIKVINANRDIYDIFEETGFTEIITVEKALRRLSVEGCDIIGRGKNGCVYRLDSDTIIKVYNAGEDISELRREQALARRAFILGVPTALSYDVVMVGDRLGAVYELIDCDSLISLVRKYPERRDELMDMYADCLRQLHAITVDDPRELTDKRAEFISRARTVAAILDPERASKLISKVESLPESRCFVHGDPHMGNIMLRGNEPVIIDMDTIGYGCGIIDLTNIYCTMVGFNLFSVIDLFGLSKEDCRHLWDMLLVRYCPDAADRDAAMKGVLLLCYVRLLEHLIRHHGKDEDIEHIKGLLISQLDKY